jgi:hypothetical protein
MRRFNPANRQIVENPVCRSPAQPGHSPDECRVREQERIFDKLKMPAGWRAQRVPRVP